MQQSAWAHGLTWTKPRQKLTEVTDLQHWREPELQWASRAPMRKAEVRRARGRRAKMRANIFFSSKNCCVAHKRADEKSSGLELKGALVGFYTPTQRVTLSSLRVHSMTPQKKKHKHRPSARPRSLDQRTCYASYYTSSLKKIISVLVSDEPHSIGQYCGGCGFALP